MNSRIKNPVITNPWLSAAPNGKAAHFKSDLLKKFLKVRNIGEMRRPKAEPVRKTKATVTKLYTEQLSPLYPEFMKCQIKAALTLSDNNLHEARLLLDYKYKIIRIKNSIAAQLRRSSLNFRPFLRKYGSGNSTSTSFSDDIVSFGNGQSSFSFSSNSSDFPYLNGGANESTAVMSDVKSWNEESAVDSHETKAILSETMEPTTNFEIGSPKSENVDVQKGKVGVVLMKNSTGSGYTVSPL
ncbi:unnamed protein product [Phyllotreta striolata]|uniref:Uncharacterized protein n=1 Tax=Phyllotreta striolata TaxID=444603 RepID=A0A9N9XLE2_PHYSR|nr:unnamed protein product [Phyllotreta striolata]